MEEKIKEIVSVFIRIPAGNIGSATRVDRSAVQSSIVLHRMYARLAEEGFVFDNYAAIKTFGELLSPANGVSSLDSGTALTGAPGDIAAPARVASLPVGHGGPWVSGDGPWVSGGGPLVSHGGQGMSGGQPEVGIDIEAIANLPRTNDFRTTEFYRMNFSPEEMAYCILQPDPYASFAGLFAAKEAITKADAQSRTKPFHTLAIGHSAEGKPFYPGFSLSISHAGDMAVAVAVRNGGAMAYQPLGAAPSLQAPVKAKTSPINWLALLLALAALLLTLLH